MKIKKKINNNVALAEDAKGRELVVFGKGVGFPSMPYELNDLSKVQRTFYGVNPQYFKMVTELPENVLLVAGEIAKAAQLELDCKLNPNLVFTLADHLNFAMERVQQGIEIPLALACEIEQMYPKEADLGRRTLNLFWEQLGVNLPDSEISAIAMHLVNAKAEHGDMHSTLLMAQLTSDIIEIVEHCMEVRLKKDSFNCSRFISHLGYLMQRLMKGTEIESDNQILFHQMKQTYPDIYQCACQIAEYLHSTMGWTCSNEEVLYLMMHINRVYYEA